MTSPLQTQSEKARRIVFVGGAGSIGAALVEAAVGRGDRVIVLDLPSSLAGRPQSGIERAIALDATDPAQVDAAFGQVGRVWDGLDGLVILPGLLRRKQPVVEFSLDDWNEVVAVSLTSTFLTVKAAIALLRRGTSPGIVTTSSGLGVRPAPGYGPYSAAKAAVISLTRTLALELAPEIRVNAIAPGLIETAFQRGGAGQPGLHEARHSRPRRRLPSAARATGGSPGSGRHRDVSAQRCVIDDYRAGDACECRGADGLGRRDKVPGCNSLTPLDLGCRQPVGGAECR